MICSNQQDASNGKLSSSHLCIAILLLIIISSCAIQDASNSQTEATNENLDAPQQMSTQPAETASNNDDGVYIQWDAPAEIFSISDAHHTTPEDILREVGEYPPDAGGGGTDCLCEMHEDFPFDSPTIIKAPQELEWRNSWEFCSCGWQPEENIHLTIKDEMGTIVFENENASGWVFACDESSFGPCFPDLTTALGEYTVLLEGKTANLSFSFHIVLPSGPRVYAYQNKLILYNFQPNEKIRLLSYSENEDSIGCWKFSLNAWDEFYVRNDGQLVLDVSEEIWNYRNIVVGDMSGEVPIFLDRSLFGLSPYHSPALSPYKKVTISRPTDEDIKRVDNLWNLVGYKDLKRPGTQTYQITIQPSNELRWGFSWCATNPEILKRIALPYDVDFFVDDVGLQYGTWWAPQMKEIYEEQPNSRGWVCQRWVTLLTNWEPNSQVVLEVRYNLHESIFDGQETYPPGEYRQIIYVNVEE